MLRKGNAMSRAPIINGMVKLPKNPSSMGMATQKTINVPCMVTNELYRSGARSPSPGRAKCRRNINAIMPPKIAKNSPLSRYCLAIILWSVEKMYLPIQPISAWWTACVVAAAITGLLK